MALSRCAPSDPLSLTTVVMQMGAWRVGACSGAVRRTVRTHCRAGVIELWPTMAEDGLNAPISGRIPYSIGQASEPVRCPRPRSPDFGSWYGWLWN